MSWPPWSYWPGHVLTMDIRNAPGNPKNICWCSSTSSISLTLCSKHLSPPSPHVWVSADPPANGGLGLSLDGHLQILQGSCMYSIWQLCADNGWVQHQLFQKAKYAGIRQTQKNHFPWKELKETGETACGDELIYNCEKLVLFLKAAVGFRHERAQETISLKKMKHR